MDQKEIRELEPKYTGNQRHMTEGEAAAIRHDPANENSDDALGDVAENVPPVGLLGYNRQP
jgi:hypothetical protein